MDNNTNSRMTPADWKKATDSVLKMTERVRAATATATVRQRRSSKDDQDSTKE